MTRGPAPTVSTAGFTGIELVLVLAITGLMLAIAFSAYQTYRVRAQIAASIEATEPLRNAVAELYLSEQRAPSDVAALRPGLRDWAVAHRFVAGLRLVDGRIDLRYGRQANAAIAGRTISLTPYESAALEIVWICGNRIPGAGLSPLGFSAGGAQATQITTTIEARYLPRNCR